MRTDKRQNIALKNSLFTRNDPYQCEKCNCNGHSDKCQYNETIAANGLSMDIHGNYEGGGVCEECQHNTEGTNCHQCDFGFKRRLDVPMNDTEPCERKIILYLFSSLST